MNETNSLRANLGLAGGSKMPWSVNAYLAGTNGMADLLYYPGYNQVSSVLSLAYSA